MARAATSAELIKMRSKQRSIVYLLVHTPSTVYSARVNQSSFSDPLAEVSFDGGSGSLSSVRVGMTVYIGSSAGAYDLGMCVIRKLPDDTKFYLGETSEISWADDLYITVVNEFSLWQKALRISGSTVYMDYDIPYSDQHENFDPVPVMGSDRVLMLSGGSVSTQYDWSDSWVYDSTISGYFCQVSGAGSASIDDETSATPTITFTTAGWYCVSITITSASGKTASGYRYVYVMAEDTWPDTQFTLDSPIVMDSETGGCNFTVSIYANADLSSIRKRARVILFSRDWYGEDEGSIGPVEGCENILATGWIANEQIVWDPENNKATFQVEGAAFWLNQQESYPVGIEYSTVPTAWTSLDGLTVDRGLWHLLHWRSTATLCMDISLTGNSLVIPSTEAPKGTIWEQIKYIANSTLVSEPRCDRFGRLFVEEDLQITPESDRTSIPTVMELTQNDFSPEFFIERMTIPSTSQLEASGISYDGSSAIPMSSIAPGSTMGHYGRPSAYDSLLVDDQDRLNELCGQLFAWENNEFPAADLELVQNNRLIDVCPRQRLTISLAASDTVRGLVWTNKKFIPRRIEINYDAEGGYLSMAATLEAETTGVDGKTVDLVTDTPDANDVSIDPGEIVIPSMNFPTGSIYFPTYIPSKKTYSCADDIGLWNGPQGVYFDKTVINNGEEAIGYYPCGIRASGEPHETFLKITVAEFEASYPTLWTIHAVDNSLSNVLSPSAFTHVEGGIFRFNFEPASCLNVAGFKIALAAGGGLSYSPGAVMASGAVAANNTTGVELSGLTIGNYYCVDGVGGPFDANPVGYSYGFNLWQASGMTTKIGAAGWGSYSGWHNYFYPPGVAVEKIDQYHGRLYWQANATSVWFTAGAADEDYSGSIGYLLREAIATSNRRLEISFGSLFNIAEG